VDTSYNLTPTELCAKVALCDALIIRSATQVCLCCPTCAGAPWLPSRRRQSVCLPSLQALAACAGQVTREVFEASKGRLKVVGRAGVGVDNVDLAAATEVRSWNEQHAPSSV
jgi:D-3-phosphoglycerate dehydrogenase / 2-oxoglutarate reductase